MVRLLLLIAFVIVVAMLVGRVVKSFTATRTPAGGGEASPDADAKLVRCARCGAYVPRRDAIAGAGGFRCADPKCRAE